MTTYDLMLKIKETLEAEGFKTSSPEFSNLRDFEYQGHAEKGGKYFRTPVEGYNFRKEKDMDDWKVRIQYIDRYETLMDMTEVQAKKIFNDLKTKMYEKQIVWCELIHSTIDADEEIIMDFENKVISVMGQKMIV